MWQPFLGAARAKLVLGTWEEGRGTASCVAADPDSSSSLPQEEFGYNAETQKLLCKNGETLLGAVNFFVSSINTLVNKTMEDTLMTVKQYETAR